MKSHLSVLQMEVIKEKMLLEKQRLLNELEHNNQELAQDSQEDVDEVDKAVSDQNNDQKLRFHNRSVMYLKKINKALDKIEANTYAICEDCDAEIKFERLKARPTADLCIECKEESERDENSSFTGRQSKSLGESISIIKNG